ncbi:hypothetical protein GCM10025869_33920 [Homoserinibacter gongjuensis]|uniref:Segregation and condensation protein A n=1 Tax=Homoserinibacter gongjuensis TaxID=1162968 RepID=A0ABQ6JX31_9MICO|nr:hypothetical protein GCM10025869_33920 [Homoserinibacter gongjuensis]
MREAAETVEAVDETPGFRLTLSNFDGPFDLLLSLITKHELDITEVSLSKVTDEFISYLKGLDSADELDQASEFLVVAATLLDLKVAGLLPQGELVDAEDVALLEARDLLFARLLQYRAFKEAARWFEGHLDAESGRHARSVRLEEKYRRQTPSSSGRSACTTSRHSPPSRWRRARSPSWGWTICTRRSSASGSRRPSS